MTSPQADLCLGSKGEIAATRYALELSWRQRSARGNLNVIEARLSNATGEKECTQMHIHTYVYMCKYVIPLCFASPRLASPRLAAPEQLARDNSSSIHHDNQLCLCRPWRDSCRCSCRNRLGSRCCLSFFSLHSKPRPEDMGNTGES